MAKMVVQTLLDDSYDHHNDGRTHYAPSGWRKTIFAFVFLLLLPFALSLPVMIYQRIVSGAWMETWGIFILAVAIFLITLLVFFELMYSLRAEVEVGDKAVRFTVPRGKAGLFPNFFYRTEYVPYAEIDRLEQVCEVRGGALTPLLLNCTRIVKHDGTSIDMGSCHEQNPDHTFPYHLIARQVADKAQVEILDCGHVRQKRAFGLLQPGRPLGAPEAFGPEGVSRINRLHGRIVAVLVVALVVLLGLGIASDVTKHGGALIGGPTSQPIVYPGAKPAKPIEAARDGN